MAALVLSSMDMRTRIIAFVLFAAACSGKTKGTSSTGDMAGAGTDVTSIDVSPSSVQLQILNGAPPAPTAFTATAHYADGHTADITQTASWSIADVSLGTIGTGTFTAGVAHGGFSTVTASSGSATGTAQVEVDYAISRDSTDDNSTAPASSATLFAGATPDSTLAPGILYPLDGVTVPLNLGQLEIQWAKPTGAADLFEVALSGAALDVRIYTNATSEVGGGYRLSLQPTEWSAIAATVAGSAVKITITGMASATPTTSGASAAATINVDAQPVNGGIYYWTPTNQGVERRAFDDGTAPPTDFYSTTDTGGHCVACHVLSRDGKKAVVTFDGGGGQSTMLDVATKTETIPESTTFAFDFAAFSPDSNKLVVTQIGGTLGILDTSGTTGNVLATITPDAGTYATHPDWSADGNSIVFVEYPIDANSGSSDFSFLQGSIVVVTADATGAFGAPKPLVTSAGENNFYPSFSPDSKWILFNRAPNGSSYNNPAAAVMVVAADGSGQPITLGNSNATGMLTDSWPRWSPFVQTYADGSTRLYFTFSSKRDYGIELQQPADPGSQRPQIWMAAFAPALAKNGQDPSSVPFWLPFQDITTNNHIAQWTTAIIGPVN